MAPVAAPRSGRGSSSIFQGLLSGVMLVGAIIVGLLAMHALNLHGTAAADAPAAISMSAAEPAAAHHGNAEAHPSGRSTTDAGMSCAGCGTDDHASMAMMCVLALLLALLLLAAPGVLRCWSRAFFRLLLIETLPVRVLPRAPSLHVLCISRT